MTQQRPEYVKCLLDEHATDAEKDRFGTTLCERRVQRMSHGPEGFLETWTLGHWFWQARQGGRFLACPECAAQLRQATEPESVWDGMTFDPDDADDEETKEET